MENNEYRKFGGMRYQFYTWKETKPAAEKVAKEMRQSGYLARIVKGKPISPTGRAKRQIWFVYVRKK